MNKAQSRHVEMSLSPWHIWPKELAGTALFLDAPSRISVPSHRPSLPLSPCLLPSLLCLQLAEPGYAGSASALMDVTSDAIFEIARPTLDTLYGALCADPDTLYAHQLREMRCLLPQHVGLRRELWLMPAPRTSDQTAGLWAPPAHMADAAALQELARSYPPRPSEEEVLPWDEEEVQPVGPGEISPRMFSPIGAVQRRSASAASMGGSEGSPTRSRTPSTGGLAAEDGLSPSASVRASWSDAAAGMLHSLLSPQPQGGRGGGSGRGNGGGSGGGNGGGNGGGSGGGSRGDSGNGEAPEGAASARADRAADEEAFGRVYSRTLLRSLRIIQQAWRGRSVGPLGHGPFRKTVAALRELAELPTPVLKAERVLRALNLLALEVAGLLQAESSAEEIAADELLPLFVFVLVRARVPRLYSQSRYISDFLPKQYALGRHGYSLATLQAALQYLLETSWASIPAAAARERQLREEQRRRSARELAQRQAGSERLVELCDCPYGCTHGVVLRDTTGRILQRGDHLVRGTRARAPGMDTKFG